MKGMINIPITVFKEGDRFISYSPAIDLSTSGETFEEARKKFAEATVLFFEEIVDKGTVDEVLEDLGWHKVDHNWQPPVIVAQERQEITVSL